MKKHNTDNIRQSRPISPYMLIAAIVAIIIVVLVIFVFEPKKVQNKVQDVQTPAPVQLVAKPTKSVQRPIISNVVSSELIESVATNMEHVNVVSNSSKVKQITYHIRPQLGKQTTTNIQTVQN